MNTAKGEQSTLKIPLRAQYHGVSWVRSNLTSRMPVGKHTPNRIPTGATTITDAKTFIMVEEETMLELITGRIKTSPKMAKETTTG